jgi:hypothetical protein
LSPPVRVVEHIGPSEPGIGLRVIRFELDGAIAP